LESFLVRTYWGWGANPQVDKEEIVFIDDNIFHGSGGKNHRYRVEAKTSEVGWKDHRIKFTNNLPFFKIEGRHPRGGNLLKRGTDEDLNRLTPRAKSHGLLELD
jgi:hypothetical protein